jgi:hypothetical protein
MEGKFRQIDRGIAQLAATGTDSAYAANVERLSRSQRELRERLTAMDAASDEDWPTLRDSLEVHYRRVRVQYGEVAMHETRAETADSSSLGESAQSN